MVRPCKPRHISYTIQYTCFKPAGIKRTQLEKVELYADELEAIRLINLQNLSQAEAADKMNISPSTFNRLVKSAYSKITDALVNGKGIRIYKADGTTNCN